MRRMFGALFLTALVSAPVSAELRYTVRMEMKKADAGAAPANPMFGMMGEGMMKQLLPEGSAEIVYTVGEKGTRMEFVQAALGQQAGAVNLARPDGTLYVINPKDKTYWKTTAASATAAMQASGLTPPEVVMKPSGKFDTVAGLKCEIVAFDWKMNLPIPESARASLPPDFPMFITMNGDVCSAKDQYQKYAEIAAKTVSGMTVQMGLDKIAQGGLVLRQSMQMMGFELHAVVTKIGEETVAADLFDLPADYKEVPAPAMGPR